MVFYYVGSEPDRISGRIRPTLPDHSAPGNHPCIHPSIHPFIYLVEIQHLTIWKKMKKKKLTWEWIWNRMEAMDATFHQWRSDLHRLARAEMFKCRFLTGIFIRLAGNWHECVALNCFNKVHFTKLAIWPKFANPNSESKKIDVSGGGRSGRPGHPRIVTSNVRFLNSFWRDRIGFGNPIRLWLPNPIPPSAHRFKSISSPFLFANGEIGFGNPIRLWLPNPIPPLAHRLKPISSPFLFKSIVIDSNFFKKFQESIWSCVAEIVGNCAGHYSDEPAEHWSIPWRSGWNTGRKATYYRVLLSVDDVNELWQS